MKKYILTLLIATCFGINACNDDILELESLTEPTDATFFSNEQELNLALTGVYNSVVWRGGYGLPVQANMDNAATDIGLVRGGYVGLEQLGAGSHSASTGGFSRMYADLYRGIGRANNLIQNLDRAADFVSAERLQGIESEAVVLRAYFYHYLIELYGDVPYTEQLAASTEDALLPRVAKATIVDNLLADLQTVAQNLPDTPSQFGRVSKNFALGLRARIALYAGNYTEAASSSKQVIDNASFSLHPNFGELFTSAVSSTNEVMFVMPFQDGFVTNLFPRAQGSRNRNAWSTVVPTQSLVDSYEATDGLPIDESAVYDPSNPFENRDPRLKATIITPQSEWAGMIFESHPDSATYRRVDGTTAGRNNDCRNVIWPAAFCGYLWKKYTNEEAQNNRQVWSDVDYSLMRFAEILLIYAEAKIELGQIDETVLDAMNRVRARAYGVETSDVASYPAVTTTDQFKLREIIRRERKVEFANEGFRLFDIRRWNIAHKVVPVTLYGRILDTATATLVPDIDEDGFVSYVGVESQYDLNTDGRFPNAQNRIFNNPRDYLLPIPQSEIDTYAGNGATLEQNPGGY